MKAPAKRAAAAKSAAPVAKQAAPAAKKQAAPPKKAAGKRPATKSATARHAADDRGKHQVRPPRDLIVWGAGARSPGPLCERHCKSRMVPLPHPLHKAEGGRLDRSSYFAPLSPYGDTTPSPASASTVVAPFIPSQLPSTSPVCSPSTGDVTTSAACRRSAPARPAS